MSRPIKKVKSYKLPEKERRPLSNKFIQTILSGLASAGPPLGPVLGKYGVNIAKFCKEFNNKTSHFKPGIPLPCIVTVNPDRSFDLSFRRPSVEYYLMQAAGITSFEKYNGISGKLTRKHIYEIAKIKHEDSFSYVQLKELKDVVQLYLMLAYKHGIEIVDHIDTVEYEQYLREREEYLAKLAAEWAAAQEAKLSRA